MVTELDDSPRLETPPRRDHDRRSFRFLFGVLGAVPTVSLAVPVSALLSVLLVPIRPVATLPTSLKRLIVLALLGAAAMAGSALVNGSPLNLGGVAGFLVIALGVLGAAKSTGGTAKTTSILVWLSAATAVYLLIVGVRQPTVEALWKYGGAFPATALVLYVLAVRKDRARLAMLLLVGAGVLSLMLGSRAFGAVCLAAAIAQYARGRAGTGSRGFVKVVVAASLAAGLAWALPTLMEEGRLGADLQERALTQTEGGAPLLLGGRAEVPLSVTAVAESPVVGWGHPDVLDLPTIAQAGTLASTLGIGTYLPFWFNDDGSVSLHSVLFESWVSGGVLAAVLPLGLMVLFAQAVFRGRGRFYPLVALASIYGIWDVLFSPWAGNRSMRLAVTAVLAAWAVVESRRTAQAAPPQSDSR